MIVGVGSGSAMLLRDLQDPFQGSFCIKLAANQLTTLEELLESDISEAEAESQQVGLSAFITRNNGYPRPNYNTRNTLYFHLLTGPLAYNVRVLGDLFAWASRKVSAGWRRLKRRLSGRGQQRTDKVPLEREELHNEG